jgi:dihydroxy-acid dehydratase
VTARTHRENIAHAKVWDTEVIRPLAKPLHAEGGLAILRGSLAPTGAVIKPTAATPALLRHRGRAVVFHDHDDLNRRIDSPDLDVRPDDVLVLRNSGPVGGPGMPEWGFLPIPKKLLAAGVRDMVRLSDARMSGTAFGTVVVHVTPESAVGGPLAAVRDGDLIELDVPGRKLDLLVDSAEVARRLEQAPPSALGSNRGYQWLYARHVLQADTGCDFDFLLKRVSV